MLKLIHRCIVHVGTALYAALSLPFVLVSLCFAIIVVVFAAFGMGLMWITNSPFTVREKNKIIGHWTRKSGFAPLPSNITDHE